MFMREKASRWGPIMVYYFRRAQEQSTANALRYFEPTTCLGEKVEGGAVSSFWRARSTAFGPANASRIHTIQQEFL